MAHSPPSTDQQSGQPPHNAPPPMGQLGPPQGVMLPSSAQLMNPVQTPHQALAGRPPSPTSTPQSGGKMNPSPSMAPRQPTVPGNVPRQSDMAVINSALANIPLPALSRVKMELGLADKNISVLTSQDKLRIIHAHRAHMQETGPPGSQNAPVGPSMQAGNDQISSKLANIPPNALNTLKMELGLADKNLSVLTPLEKMRIIQSHLARMAKTGSLGSQNAAAGPSLQASLQQRRTNKRNYTSPGEDQTQPDDRSDSSPPDRKRPRRSLMEPPLHGASMPMGMLPPASPVKDQNKDVKDETVAGSPRTHPLANPNASATDAELVRVAAATAEPGPAAATADDAGHENEPECEPGRDERRCDAAAARTERDG
ncbi:LisH domain-containing protein [Mycena sanguinolenta]|uniref:LisH domain-containing protein n=1 Tax=Mycena sanguinolenta TaxID=230812 RepID=A0A8H6YMS9_9AGAR|nr:LisH domain-containing protein [Mycena sanguinolenta]